MKIQKKSWWGGVGVGSGGGRPGGSEQRIEVL